MLYNLNMEPHGFTALGGLEKRVDTRDIKLGAVKVTKAYDFPATFTNARAWAQTVEYQGQQPACGAHSGGALVGIKQNSRFSPRFTWANVKTFDGNPIEAGTDMRSIFKSLTKTGPLDFALLGNDITLSLFDYAHPVITSKMNDVAAFHKESGYGFADDFTFDGLKQYIFDHGEIILLFRIGPEMWQKPSGEFSWAEKDILPLRPPKVVTSGHFVVCHSYDENNIYFINSFSADWGRKGHGYFGVNYMPFINDAGALVTLLFSKNLYFGLTDPEVKQLQQLLNKDPRTRLTNTGLGSPGHETTYFGPLTQAAVIKLQTLYSIKPNIGYVGPLTRAVLNGLASV